MPYIYKIVNGLLWYPQVIQAPTKLISSYKYPAHQNIYGNYYDQNQNLGLNLFTDPVIAAFLGCPRTIYECGVQPGHHHGSFISIGINFLPKITQRKLFSSMLPMGIHQKLQSRNGRDIHQVWTSRQKLDYKTHISGLCINRNTILR